MVQEWSNKHGPRMVQDSKDRPAVRIAPDNNSGKLFDKISSVTQLLTVLVDKVLTYDEQKIRSLNSTGESGTWHCGADDLQPINVKEVKLRPKNRNFFYF